VRMEVERLPRLKVRCDDCGGLRQHSILAEHKHADHQSEFGFSRYWTLQIVQCLGCESFRFRDVYVNSDDGYYAEAPDGEVIWEANERIRVFPESRLSLRAVRDDFAVHTRQGR
jgi:hypothetical protein